MTPHRLLHAAAATLAGGVAIDSATEHYRARFHHRAMFVAPVVAGAALATSTSAALGSRVNSRLMSAVFAAATAAGLIGFGFHLRHTGRRIGGWRSSSNVFYGAPVAAPLGSLMAGSLGLLASHVDRNGELEASTGKLVAALAALGLAGTAVEAGLFHFRGAFQNPFMYAPVIAPPIAAATLATAVAKPSSAMRRFATALLSLTAVTGVVGIWFHAWGVHRRMGGWRNWRQNVLAGPPLLVPPAFTGLSLAGVAALRLLEPRRFP